MHRRTADWSFCPGGKEKSIAWEKLPSGAFSGELVNGKGETKHSEFEGCELSEALKAMNITVSGGETLSVSSEDNYTAELSGAEVLEPGKVYIALKKDGKMTESIEGGQGAQLVVFGDQNSKRAVKHLKRIEIN